MLIYTPDRDEFISEELENYDVQEDMHVDAQDYALEDDLLDEDFYYPQDSSTRMNFVDEDFNLESMFTQEDNYDSVGLTGQESGRSQRGEAEIAYLVGLNLGQGPESIDKTERSLLELKELAETCGAMVLGADYQNRNNVSASTYLGKGKIIEIAEYAKAMGCDTLIFDDPLSGSQIRNIQELSKMRVLDRTLVILDIFARRASTKEGKLQVELAQYSYRLGRVSLINEEMSRLGGGIGTRGPGETQLERDRRHIRNRINNLRRELKKVSTRREKEREKRDEQGQTIVAMVGYTNAGKSTLINKLTDSDLYAMDQVFATLDSAFRDLRLPDGSHVILADTVGFIRKLPHELVEAFKSTLTEVSNSDLILQVLDVSDPEAKEQLQIVEDELNRLEAADKPRILLLNKADIATPQNIEAFIHIKESDRFRVVPTSAVTGEGLDKVLQTVAEFLAYRQKSYRLELPYEESSLYAYIKDNGNLLSENFGEKMELEFTLDKRLSGPVENYLRKTYPERYVEEEF